MFGEDWPRRRMFPNSTASDGDSVSFDGISFSVEDLGPGESPHDSIWTLEGSDVAFVGDLVYNRVHAYLADGHSERWLCNLDTARSVLATGAVLHPGHGDPAAIDLLDWQERYIRTFMDAMRRARGSVSAEAAVERGDGRDEAVPARRGPVVPHAAQRSTPLDRERSVVGWQEHRVMSALSSPDLASAA